MLSINRLKPFLFIIGMMLISACNDKTTEQTQKLKKNDVTIGVQLWSVHDKLKVDFKGTIESLAGMGFEAVEFAGVFGEYANNPTGLKTYLSEMGLTVSGAHVGFNKLTDDNIDDTLEFYQQLGANYLIIPWDERAWHPIKINEFMKDLNRVYPIITKAGFAFGFHNHDLEFNDFEQHTYWDHIANKSDPNMVLQLDIGWVNFAGKDPHHYVKTYQGRTLTTHYKVRTHEGEQKTPILGQDGYDWASLFNVMREFGGTKWVIVEQEEYPNGLSSLEAVAKSKAGLDKLLSH